MSWSYHVGSIGLQQVYSTYVCGQVRKDLPTFLYGLLLKRITTSSRRIREINRPTCVLLDGSCPGVLVQQPSRRAHDGAIPRRPACGRPPEDSSP